jgi:phosphoadenosine phosphosulfate reductase
MPVKLSKADLEEANRKLAKLSPIERVNWAKRQFGESLILPSSFGPTSPVMLKLATAVVPDIPVVTISHGYETPKTIELRDWYKKQLGLNLYVHKAPSIAVPSEDSPDFQQFQRRVKAEPFQRLLHKFRPAAYFSGIMSWQNPQRRNLRFIEGKGSVIAINPVLDMSQKNVDKFFLATGLPKNDDYYDPAKGTHQSRECGFNTALYK